MRPLKDVVSKGVPARGRTGVGVLITGFVACAGAAEAACAALVGVASASGAFGCTLRGLPGPRFFGASWIILSGLFLSSQPMFSISGLGGTPLSTLVNTSLRGLGSKSPAITDVAVRRLLLRGRWVEDEAENIVAQRFRVCTQAGVRESGGAWTASALYIDVTCGINEPTTRALPSRLSCPRSF